jgi:hypothetical protein
MKISQEIDVLRGQLFECFRKLVQSIENQQLKDFRKYLEMELMEKENKMKTLQEENRKLKKEVNIMEDIYLHKDNLIKLSKEHFLIGLNLLK